MLLFFGPSAFSATFHEVSNALPFFRHPQSQFPSGQASRNDLEQKLLHVAIGYSFVVSWDNKTFNLDGDQIIRDIHTARFVETKFNCEMLSEGRSNAKSIKRLPGKTQLEILGAEDYWARVKDIHSSTEGWLPLELLQNKNNDPGVFVALIDTPLRKGPDMSSGKIKTLPRLQRFVPLEILPGFVKVQYENKVGYADINNFISRADFASLAYSKKLNWTPISHRDGSNLIPRNAVPVPLTEVLGYVTTSTRGIVVRTEGNSGPSLRSRVEIIKPEASLWAQSRMDGHGDIWWKKENVVKHESPKTITATTLSTDELLKREITSIAFESNSLRGIASSDGIYRTEDGVTWNLIPEFDKKDQPVAILPNGNWFVGSFKSLDKGKTFAPFIRWELITAAIENSLHHSPKMLRLTQIEPTSDSEIQLHLHTGTQNVKIKGPLHGLSWSVIKNKHP